jgi:biopolymer transport protein ExbD
MRGRTARQPDEADVDLTPMLDVVFILLIFFIVTATFTQEQALGLEPPPPPNDTPQEPVPSILIYIDEAGLITVNGRVTDVGSVRANIERVKAEAPDSSVVIQAHTKAASGTVILIRDAAYNAGYDDRVNFVVSGE